MFLPAEVAGGDKLRLSVTARIFLTCLHFSSFLSFSSQSPPLSPPAPPLLWRQIGGIAVISWLCFPKLLGHLFKAVSRPHVQSVICRFINPSTQEQVLCPSPCLGTGGAGAAPRCQPCPSSFSPDNMGLLDPATSDGRVIFFLPWEKMTIAGTTDSPTDVTSHPIPTEEDINFILSEVRNYLGPDVEGKAGARWGGWGHGSLGRACRCPRLCCLAPGCPTRCAELQQERAGMLPLSTTSTSPQLPHPPGFGHLQGGDSPLPGQPSFLQSEGLVYLKDSVKAFVLLRFCCSVKVSLKSTWAGAL